MATICIFGGSGFLAHHIVPLLAQDGHVIRLACRNPEAANGLKTAGAVGQIVPIAANLNHRGSIEAAIKGVDIVINLVGILHERGTQNFHAIHEAGAIAIAELAKENNVKRLIHISAIGADSMASSRYAASKGRAEKAMKAIYKDITILRPSVVFGAQDSFINLFAKMMTFFPIMPLFGGGVTRFQPVFVGDVAKAVQFALGEDKTKGKIYELGGPEILSLRDILERIKAYTNRRVGFIPLPFPLASLMAQFTQLAPNPILTPDNVESMKQDNIVTPKSQGFKALGITPLTMDEIVPDYCDLYRKGGRFSKAFSKTS